jgi:hypothetical protein
MLAIKPAEIELYVDLSCSYDQACRNVFLSDYPSDYHGEQTGTFHPMDHPEYGHGRETSRYSVVLSRHERGGRDGQPRPIVN